MNSSRLDSSRLLRALHRFQRHGGIRVNTLVFRRHSSIPPSTHACLIDGQAFRRTGHISNKTSAIERLFWLAPLLLKLTQKQLADNRQ